jgi:hypothetical protein
LGQILEPYFTNDNNYNITLKKQISHEIWCTTRIYHTLVSLWFMMIFSIPTSQSSSQAKKCEGKEWGLNLVGFLAKPNNPHGHG